jgi:formate dehydrogenase major subunit
MLNVTIDGIAHQLPPGLTLHDAMRRIGTPVPTLCHDARLKPAATCRLCLVQVDGHDKPLTACSTRLEDGMVIRTDVAELEAERKTLLEWLAQHYPRNATERAPDKPFHFLLHRYGVRARGDDDPTRVDASHPYLRVDMNRCINCYRCVRICAELQGQDVWHVVGRGDTDHIVPGLAATLAQSSCVACGACVDTCPTGALEDSAIADGEVPEQWTRTVCPYCGTGCELELGVKAGRAIVGRPVNDAPSSHGHLCVKGRYAVGFGASKDRLTQPLLREGNGWRAATWREAVAFIAARTKAIKQQHGPRSLAMLGSARGTNEENYLAQKFARIVLGTHNVDCCARVCHTPTAAAMKLVLGAGAATNSYDDIERARTILVCGANPTENHPVIGARIKQAVRRGAQLIVIDPRRTELAELAHVHVAVEPGGNIPLLNAVAHVIVSEALFDRAFVAARVDEFNEFRDFVAAWSPDVAAPLCGVPAETIRAAARLYATHGPAFTVHGLGITEHVQGTEGVMALCNLALLTGNLGKPGCGINPLRGQNNVQGAAHMGADPGILTGSVAIESARAAFEQAWGVPLPKEPGLHLLQMMDAAEAGALKMLWCIGYDVLLSNANAAATRRALGNLELLVVSDLFMDETAREYAHVVLPAASGFEKEGTYMNAERRVQRVRRALAPPGEARSDWEAICAVAGELGYATHFGFKCAEDIWNEVRAVWPHGAGMSYARLDAGGLQWPCPDERHPGTTILHVDRFPMGPRAALRRIEFHATPETVSDDYPLRMITGRTLYQFNAATMTGRTLNHELRPTDTLDMSAADARRLGISDHDPVRVRSRHGEATLPARISAGMKPGEVFATFHDPRVFINNLTSPHRDRFVKTPEYKVTAVRVERA